MACWSKCTQSSLVWLLLFWHQPYNILSWLPVYHWFRDPGTTLHPGLQECWMFFSKLGFTPLLFTVGISGILKGVWPPKEFLQYSSGADPIFFLVHFTFPFSLLLYSKKTLLSNSLGNVPSSNPSNMTYPSGGLGSEIKGRVEVEWLHVWERSHWDILPQTSESPSLYT